MTYGTILFRFCFIGKKIFRRKSNSENIFLIRKKMRIECTHESQIFTMNRFSATWENQSQTIYLGNYFSKPHLCGKTRS